LNVAEEIAKNSEPTPIKNLFSEGILENALMNMKKQKSRNNQECFICNNPNCNHWLRIFRFEEDEKIG
jgi:hypothetical protein